MSTRPDLSSAPRVVSGGRALKSQENFSTVLDPLADALGAGESTSKMSLLRLSAYLDVRMHMGEIPQLDCV